MQLFAPKQKLPPVQKAEPPPSVDDARSKLDDRAARRTRAGRASLMRVQQETPVSTTRNTTGY